MNNEKHHEVRVKQKINGTAVIKKKSAFAKIRDMFIAEDADKVGSYILMDVIVPAVKRTIVDMIKSSADMIFGTRGSSQSSGTRYVYGGGSTPYITYGSSVKKQTEMSDSKRDPFDFSYIEFNHFQTSEENKQQAEIVVETMCDIIDSYKKAYVADLCDVINAPCEYTANYYGWTDLHNLVPIKIPGTVNWYLKFPKATQLDKD